MAEQTMITNKEEQSILTELAVLNNKVDNIETNVATILRKQDVYVDKILLDATLDPLRARIRELEGSSTWISRLVGGAVILAILGLILVR